MAIPREPDKTLSNTVLLGLRRDYTPAPQITKAYLLGMLHDATERQITYRIASKSFEFCKVLKVGINSLGSSAWIYKEGKSRNLWIVEFSKNLLKGTIVNSKQDKIDFVRGYFDSEGGIAKSPKVRYYIYFAQKDKKDLLQVRGFLEEIGISCGKMHNPSERIDSDYWRFFVRAKSYEDFAKTINSSHPDKRRYLRMKI
jgi:intein-encoded DNA endonuclease-like protein